LVKGFSDEPRSSAEFPEKAYPDFTRSFIADEEQSPDIRLSKDAVNDAGIQIIMRDLPLFIVRIRSEVRRRFPVSPAGKSKSLNQSRSPAMTGHIAGENGTARA
jgi:hypothetical protein